MVEDFVIEYQAEEIARIYNSNENSISGGVY